MENSFVEWRYFYSEDTQRVAPQFYKAFIAGIRIVAVAEKNELTQLPDEVYSIKVK